MDLSPICNPSPAKKNEMLIFGLCSTSDDQPGWSIDSNPIHHPSTPKKNEMPVFRLHSNSDDKPGWSMDSNSICHPSPAKKMKCSFLEYVQLPMIGQAGWWTQTPSATSLQPKKWNPHFWNTFNSWWSAGLVDGLEPHLPPLSSHKNEILIFGLHSTSDDWPGWSMYLNPIYHLSPATKMKCSFLDYVQLLMIGRAGRWTWALCAISLQPKKWNAHFWVTFNFWWSARLVDGLKPHLQPLSSQKKLNALFWITFNFWWLPGLINWLELHPPPLSSQKNEMLIFILHSNSDDKPGWSMDSNPICHPSPAKKNEMLIFGICSTSDDQPGWSMDLNPICHLSPAKKMKCSFLDYIQLLMIGRAGR